MMNKSSNAYYAVFRKKEKGWTLLQKPANKDLKNSKENVNQYQSKDSSDKSSEGF